MIASERPGAHAGAPARVIGRDVARLAALALLGFAATAWLRPLALPDEGRYVGVAWEMLQSGDWLVPTLGGLPYFHKPPLFYWITAAALGVFGPHELAARAAPLLGATVGSVAAIAFAMRWCGLRSARTVALALVVQPLFLLQGQYANLDMLVAGFIAACILSFADAALCAERGLPHRAALLGGFAAAALAVLAKGLIGALLPALVLGTWLVVRRRWRVGVALLWWPGPLLFVALALPWFVAMQARFDGFLHYFFVVQHFSRFATGGFNNVQPFWFYPVLLLAFSLPWWPWLAKPLRRDALADPVQGPVRWLLVLWIVVVVVFFSLPKSKLVGYVLPAVVPMCLLVAQGRSAFGEASRRARRGWQAAAAIGLVASLGTVVAARVLPLPSARELGRTLAQKRQAHEPVLMVGRYWFDLGFYAGLREPARMVLDRFDPANVQRDDWRRELVDAAVFAPQRASVTLVPPQSFVPALCAVPVTWVVGPSQVDARPAALAALTPVFLGRRAALWRVDARSLGAAASLPGCAGRPNVGSEDR